MTPWYMPNPFKHAVFVANVLRYLKCVRMHGNKKIIMRSCDFNWQACAGEIKKYTAFGKSGI